MRMGIGLGVGINRSNYAQGIFSAYQSRVIADGGVTEAGACVDAVSGLLQTASLLLIPSGYKSGKAYAEIPTNGNGDLTWTRASTALRTNSSGLLESMGSGVPRLSYMYGSCPALLLEPQRTNLLQNQLSYNASTGVAYNTSVTDSPIIGINSARITKNEASGSVRYANQSCSNSALTGSTTYTISAYFKYDGYDFQTSMEYNNSTNFGGTSWTQPINIASTGITLGTSSQCTGNIQNVGNGWYRVSVTITTGASPVGSTVTYLMRLPSTLSTGQGFLQAVPQFEQGAYSTTVIPTSGATATRVADSFSRSNIYTNGLISASGGTWFVELRNNVAVIADNAPSGFWLGTSSGTATSDGTIYFRQGGGTQRTNVWKYVSGTATQLYQTTTDTTKIAIKWNGTTADIFENGTKVVSGTAFTATNMEFLTTSGVGRPFFIQNMALFNSALTDAQCQTLTT